jgi:hypothetical protein
LNNFLEAARANGHNRRMTYTRLLEKKTFKVSPDYPQRAVDLAEVDFFRKGLVAKWAKAYRLEGAQVDITDSGYGAATDGGDRCASEYDYVNDAPDADVVVTFSCNEP